MNIRWHLFYLWCDLHDNWMKVKENDNLYEIFHKDGWLFSTHHASIESGLTRSLNKG